jgi:DNA helicase-2/ATP-dependent DNA helicase PcrA
MLQNSGNNEQVGWALDVLNVGLRPYIANEMSRVKGERWADSIQFRDGRRPSTTWDIQILLSVMWEHWNEVFGSKIGRNGRTLVAELRDTRNRWAHQEPFSEDDAYRALDTAERLLKSVSDEHALKIAERKEQLIRARRPAPPPVQREQRENDSRQHEAEVSAQHVPGLVGTQYEVRQRFGRSEHSRERGADTLNAQQQKAVLHRDSHLLILAGAGTGKTKTLIYRTADLLKSTPAENIVVMSFTIKAAQELYERLCGAAHMSEISQLWIGTFHSICRRILCENCSILGYTPRFGVLDTDDSLDVLRRCVPHGEFLDAKRVYQMYSLSRNLKVQWQSLLGKFMLNGREEFVAETLSRYLLRMRRANRMDFDALLTNTILLLETYPEIRQRYQQRFKHLLIDEYQDTSRAQSRILELLASDANITVVGDDSQAIYGFRGATVENILKFDSSFSGAATIRLEQNYRCTPEILNVANKSIANNKRRMHKNLFTATGSSRKPVFIEASDRASEATFVGDEILTLYRAGLKLRDMAVLSRSAFCVRVVEDALQSRRVPYMLFGATPFFSQPHIKDLLAWLALIGDPEDAFGITRVWRQQRGLTDSLLGQMEAQADKDDKPLWQIAFDFAPGTKSETRTALEELQFKLSLCRDEYEKTRNLTLLFDSTLNLHFADYIQRTFADADARLEDLVIVREMLKRYSNLEMFLDEIGTEKLDVARRISTTGYDAGDFVSLTSIHSAKGLEWKAVFLVGVVDGWIPDKRCLDESGLEEERRLFHVAITRARENLYLTAPRNVYDQRGDYSVPLSRFVRELPETVYDSISSSTREVPI